MNIRKEQTQILPLVSYIIPLQTAHRGYQFLILTKDFSEFQAIIISFFELETVTWNPNIALSQSRTSRSPVFCLCCSKEAGQFNPRVFERAETAALTWWGVVNEKLKILTYYFKLHVPIFSVCMCLCSTSSSCIMDWDAPAESRGRILYGAYISFLAWISFAAAMIWSITHFIKLLHRILQWMPEKFRTFKWNIHKVLILVLTSGATSSTFSDLLTAQRTSKSTPAVWYALPSWALFSKD